MEYNEPLNLCIKNSATRTRDSDTCDASTDDRSAIDYDEVCLTSRGGGSSSTETARNYDKIVTTTTKTNGQTASSSSASNVDDVKMDLLYDGFVRPHSDDAIVNGSFTWSQDQLKETKPNLFLQQQQLEQYLLLQQYQSHQQTLMNNTPDGTAAKMHLDKYLKLTNRYLDTMSPFFQYFTPLVNQNQAGPSTSATNVQAAAAAAATLLLTSNLNTNDDEHNRKSPATSESPDEQSPTSSNQILNNDSIRYFLNKLIEHNFLQQLQQQQTLNDMINNNNHQNNDNNNATQKLPSKSPASNDGDGQEYFNHQMMAAQNNHHTKTFLDFLKSAAAAQNAAAVNVNHTPNSHHTNNRTQCYKRWESLWVGKLCNILFKAFTFKKKKKLLTNFVIIQFLLGQR